MEKKLITQLHAAAHQVMRDVVCSGSAAPGSVMLAAYTFHCASGEWWVVDGPAWDELMQALTRAELERDQLLADEVFWLTRLEAAVRAMRQNLVLWGHGPVAPVFDDFDQEVESRRGTWVVIEGRAYPDFRAWMEA